MKQDRYEIRFSGSGGQGIIMAAFLMAEAVGVYDGKHVCQTQSYGPEARGGTSKAEVIISNKEIDYPKAMRLDMLLAMNEESAEAHFMDLKHDGLLVVDATLVRQVPTTRVASIPFTEIAIKETGKELSANMVALGAVGHLSGVVSMKGLEAAVTERAPKGTEKANLKALRAGVKAAKKLDLSSLPPTVISDRE